VIGKTPITGDPVILAPGRDERPNVYDGAPCPFCPGAEEQTPPEIARDGDPWRIRVFPNRYPPTEHAEVVVESANHDDVFEALSPDHARRAIEITFDRYHALASKAAYVCIFKNHGRLAGASIPHLHSQLVGTPFVPPRPAREGEAFGRATSCMLCDLLHTRSPVRLSAKPSTIAGSRRAARLSPGSSGSCRRRTSTISASLTSWRR